MTAAMLVRGAARELARHDVQSPTVTAEILLAWALGTDRAGMYARAGFTDAEAAGFEVALRRRCSGIPLQHVTGDQPFRGLPLTVRPGVFVPRPETELLAGAAIELVRGVERPLAADIGTGTGAIALAIAAEVPNARVVAVDLDPAAVALAHHNARRLGLGIEVRHGDLLDPVEDLWGELDLVVSNPPYLEPAEFPGLPPDVLADPELALRGGTRIHRRLAKDASGALRSRGAIAVEIAASQGSEVAGMFGRRFDDVRVLLDLAGRDRVVVGRRA